MMMPDRVLCAQCVRFVANLYAVGHDLHIRQSAGHSWQSGSQGVTFADVLARLRDGWLWAEARQGLIAHDPLEAPALAVTMLDGTALCARCALAQ